MLSLNIAIGKLQEIAGLDQRVTAPAEALAGVNGAKQLTGGWRSWEGRDHQSNGLPIEPDYASKIDTGDQDIDPSISGAARFLGWLVSDADKQEQLGRATTRSSLNLLSDRAASDSPVTEEYFHDLTAFSRGLLNNTATGGWRCGLLLMSEQWEDMPESELPFFRSLRGVETAANKFSTLLTGLIYPWSSRVTESSTGCVRRG